MICPICEQNLEIIEREADIFEDDFSGIVKYAVCRDCRKQWKLKNPTASSKKREHSAERDYNQIRVVGEDERIAPPDLASLVNAAKTSQETPSEGIFTEEDPVRESGGEAGTGDDFGNPARATTRNKGRSKPGGRPKNTSLSKRDKPSNRQRKTSRDSGEQPGAKPGRPSRLKEDEPKDKPKHSSRTRGGRPKDKPKPSQGGIAGPVVKKRHPSRTEGKTPRQDRNQPAQATFKLIRIGLAILSVLAFLYLSIQGYITYYLDYVRFRGAIPISMTVAVFTLGLFSLIAGIFLFVTLKKDGIIPFIVPSFLYLIGGVIAFFFREDSRLLLSGAIIALIVAIILIILVLIDKIKHVEE